MNLQAIWHHLYHKSTASDIGTLYNIKSSLSAPVEEDPFKDYYATCDLLDRYTIAYLVTGGLAFFDMETCDSVIGVNAPPGDVTYEYMLDSAQQFVEKYVTFKFIDTDAHAPQILELKCRYCDKMFKARASALISHEKKVHGHAEEQDELEHLEEDHVYNYTCLSLALCLLRWEHNHAIKYGDGQRIMNVLKFLTLIYKTSRCPKYAFAMLETQCQVKILLSPRDAHLQTWNRVVNHQGKEDSNFPNDQDMEHQNRIFKNEAKTYRGKFTEQTLKRVSQSAQATEDICKNFDYVTSVFRPSGNHPAPDWSSDIAKLVRSMKNMDLFEKKAHGRVLQEECSPPSPDVLEFLKVNDIKAWLKSCFTKFSRKHYYQY